MHACKKENLLICCSSTMYVYTTYVHMYMYVALVWCFSVVFIKVFMYKFGNL